MRLPPSEQTTEYFPNTSENIIKNILAVSERIFAARTTNLNVVKDKMGHILGNAETTKPESNYKFSTRFVLHLILTMMPKVF